MRIHCLSGYKILRVVRSPFFEHDTDTELLEFVVEQILAVSSRVHPAHMDFDAVELTVRDIFSSVPIQNTRMLQAIKRRACRWGGMAEVVIFGHVTAV